MSGQWKPEGDYNPDTVGPEVAVINARFKYPNKELTEKQVMAAHERTQVLRFPTVRMYLEEFTKQLNLELQKHERQTT